MQEALLVALLLYRAAGYRRGEGEPTAQRLGEGQDVGDDVLGLEGEVGADPAERRLRLVHDQQHASLLADPLEAGEVAFRERDDAAYAQNGLCDHGSIRADRLGVCEPDADLEAGHIAAVPAVPD